MTILRTLGLSMSALAVALSLLVGLTPLDVEPRPAARPDPQVRAHRIAHEPQPVVAAGGAIGGVWQALAGCESGGRWNYNGSSGYDGGLQFHPRTWSAYAPSGYPAYAYQATPQQQIAVAERVLASQGWGAWPACARKLGLR